MYISEALARDYHSERLRQCKYVCVGGVGERTGQAAGVTTDRDVVVLGTPPQQPVANRPSHQPGRLVRNSDERLQGVADAHTGVPSRW